MGPVDWLKTALDVVKWPMRAIVAILVLSGVLTFSPASLLKTLHGDSWVPIIRPYSGLAFLISLILLTVSGVPFLVTRLSQARTRVRDYRSRRQCIRQLDYGERTWLHQLITFPSNTIWLDPDNPSVASLLHKGLIEHIPCRGRMNDELLCSVADEWRPYISSETIGIGPKGDLLLKAQ